VAAGLAGPARASVGSVRDFILGARMINGKGEDLTFGGQVMKNVAGYDVSRLLAGSWGTLGIVTEVSLKVLPVAPGEATLMCAGIAQKEALDLLNRWGGQPLPLNASAWVHDITANPGDDYLFVRLRGAVAAVESAVTRMGADAQALGAKVLRMDNQEAVQDWRASGEQMLQFFEPISGELCLWRLSVRRRHRCSTCLTSVIRSSTSNGMARSAGCGRLPLRRPPCAKSREPQAAMPRCSAPACWAAVRTSPWV